MLDAAIAEAVRRRLPRRRHPRLRLQPARCVVHRGAGAYICGEETGAARLARGQARQPAPEAAVPGQPGPLPGPDADQQRRDAVDRPAHHRDGRRGVRQDRRRELDRHEARLGLRQRPAPGQLRDRARHARAREIIYGLAGGPPEGREVKLWFPGGSSSPVLTDGRPRPPLRLRHDGQGRLDARLRRDHRRRRLELGRRRRAVDREVLPPRVLRQVHARAARARTGP